MQPSGTNESDFPRTYREFVEKFYSNDACAAYLEELRWPTGFSCPICQAVGAPWRQTRGRLVCTACRHQTSVTTGTIMDKTRTPLTTWFETAWHLTTAKNGLSAKTLEKVRVIERRGLCCNGTVCPWYVANGSDYLERWKSMKPS